MPEPTYIDQGAFFGGEGACYRYRLWRVWDYALPRVAFVMLNPSTADARRLDPTLRRCLAYARAWGCGAFEVGNLYALRSTDPAGLWKVVDPVGPQTDEYLRQIAEDATFGVVVGWGGNAERTRADHVLALLSRYRDVFHLGLSNGGHPKHPLYLKGDLKPVILRQRRAA